MGYLNIIRSMAAAVAFAEANEHDTARSIAGIPAQPHKARSSIRQAIENIAAATAFAEAGLFREAADLAGPAPVGRMVPVRPSFLDIVGLQHAPVHVLVTTG